MSADLQAARERLALQAFAEPIEQQARVMAERCFAENTARPDTWGALCGRRLAAFDYEVTHLPDAAQPWAKAIYAEAYALRFRELTLQAALRPEHVAAVGAVVESVARAREGVAHAE